MDTAIHGLGGLVGERGGHEVAGHVAGNVTLPVQVRPQFFAANASDAFDAGTAISRDAPVLPMGDVLIEYTDFSGEFGRSASGGDGAFKREERRVGFLHGAYSINTPLALLSTTSFTWSNRAMKCENQRMVDFPTVSDRLDHVIRTCGYPTPAEFFDALGLRAQNNKNWRERNSFGRSDVRIHEVTGADIGWLKTGKGIPFPEGPIPYSGADPKSIDQRIRELQDDVELNSQMISVIAQVSATTPGAGEELARRLRALGPSSTPPGLAVVIRAVEEARRSMALAGQRAAPAKSAEKPPRKGR